MRLSPFTTALAALVTVAIAGYIGLRLLSPTRPLLMAAAFAPARITPNGDGDTDVTQITYSLSRSAKITVALQNKVSGQTYYFRKDEDRPNGDFQVLFSGIVDGYTLPGEAIDGTIETRLIPNGDYIWTVTAQAKDNGESAALNGSLQVADGDPTLPLIRDFSASPQVFTPNQDGIDDRVSINVYLPKPATLLVYLLGADGKQYYIAERDEGRKPGEPGAHFFDYDGGLDNNIEPPPDGTYTINAVAQDTVGQRVRRTATITLKDGGLPNAEIVPQATGCTVCWSTTTYDQTYFTDNTHPGKLIDLPKTLTVQSTVTTISMPQDDLLFFRLTVSNYGTTPLRTIGPWPGTVYQYDQTNAAMETDKDVKSGAWRIGVQCEQSETSYPWRWAIGAQDQLQKVTADNGDVYWYLPAGTKDHPSEAVVWGAIRMTRIYKTRNPQECFAALIHEDVAIPNLQDHVGPVKVTLTTSN
jgi:hypothetical protein